MENHKPGKKERLASILGASGVLKLKEKTLLPGGRLFVLAYHRVLDIIPERYPFDEDIVSASCEEFDRQMGFVSRNFDVITFAALKDCLEGAVPVPKRPLVITFDDGYGDNYLNAFPILKRHSLPATIFVATGYMGTHEPFWFEKVVFWAKRSQDIRGALKRMGIFTGEDGRVTPEEILRFLKRADDAVRTQVMEELEKARFDGPNEEEAGMVRPLTWDEIREMSAWGIEFGSHTVSHPVLSRVSEEKLHHELRESKGRIEAEINREVLAISYPVGKGDAQNSQVIDAAVKSGYLFGIAYDTGVDPMDSLDRYRIRRVAVEYYTTFDVFRSQLFFPRLFC